MGLRSSGSTKTPITHTRQNLALLSSRKGTVNTVTGATLFIGEGNNTMRISGELFTQTTDKFSKI